MNKLPGNFSLEKYGLKVRLVNESDADFILSLRANPNRTKYMVTLNDEVESQKKWIQEYKTREEKGLDYYFIYSNGEGKPLGVNRISHLDFDAKSGKSSSWIAIEGLKYETLKMLLIGNEIVFNLIGIDISWGEVFKNNSSAIKIFKLFGYKLEDVGEEYYNFTLIKSDFLEACESNIIKRIITNKW